MLMVIVFVVLIVPVWSHLLSFLILSSAGADPSGGNADLSSDAHHVSLQTAPGAVWVQWACCQPPSGCGLLCSESAPPSLSTERHRRQEGGGQPEPSGLSCQTCSGAQSSPVAGHTLDSSLQRVYLTSCFRPGFPASHCSSCVTSHCVYEHVAGTVWKQGYTPVAHTASRLHAGPQSLQPPSGVARDLQ